MTCLPSCLRTSLLSCLFLLSHLFISSCSNDKSSTIDPELLKQKTPEQVQQHKQQALEQETALAAADLEVTTYKVLSPNEQAPFTLNTSPQQYSDANLQISLTASTTSPDSSIVIRSQWTQLQGPQAIIVTPDSLSTLAVMPNVDKPTKLIFRIAAVDSTNYVTSTTSVVYVSPPPPTTPPVTDTSFTQQANVTPGASVTSNAISVGAISEATIISIVGGEYSLDGGTTFTQQQATVGPGDSVIIRLNASQNQGTTTLATLSIGGTIYSFSVSTEAAVIPPPTQGPTETPKEFRPFITTWETEARGDTNQVTINTDGVGYNYSINWGDGLSNENVTGTISHIYQQPGTYSVAISGDFPRLSFGNRNGITYNLLSIEQWGDIEWESMADAFFWCVNLVSNAIDAPNLSKVTDMSFMFQGATAFNQDLSRWDVSSITNMRGMFQGVTAFNQDLSRWDVSSVTDMRYMFLGATAFNQDLSRWDASSVTDMYGMFNDATAFNQDLSSWDVSSVTDMSFMFMGATAFNQDLSRWDVSSVINMYGMFHQATAFNQDLSRWDVSSVIHMNGMFQGATAFNQDLSSWDISSVTDMYVMFEGATAFNQDLSRWDVSSVTSMSSILTGSAFSTENYDALLLSWSGQPLRSGVAFSVNASYSSSSQAARDVLTNTFGWRITDGGIKDETVVDAN